MHTVKPLDADSILAAAQETGAVFTLEEHSVVGGLGGAVAELLAEAAQEWSYLSDLAFLPLLLCGGNAGISSSAARAFRGPLASAIRSMLEKSRTLAATSRVSLPIDNEFV